MEAANMLKKSEQANGLILELEKKKQSRRADKGWSSSFRVWGGLTDLTVKIRLLRIVIGIMNIAKKIQEQELIKQ
jgi:hypothetical protein